jgi:hypothetical protein
MPEIPLLGQPKEEKPEPQIIDATTAYLVVINKDGTIFVSPDINIPITIDRPVTGDEIFGSSHVIIKDIQREETAMQAAQHTMNAQMQLARQIQDAQANSQVMNRMGPLK